MFYSHTYFHSIGCNNCSNSAFTFHVLVMTECCGRLMKKKDEHSANYMVWFDNDISLQI